MRALWIVLFVLASSEATAKPVALSSDEQFESTVIMSHSCWAVLFTSSTREAESVAAEKLVEDVAAELPGLSLAKADVDAVKAFASEFNVRKRSALCLPQSAPDAAL